MKKIAQENNGELISNIWIDTKTLYLFVNKNGIQFKKSYNKLIQYGWPKTEKAINQDEINLKDLRENADKSGFDLLDNKWVGIYNKYRFRDRVSQIECLIFENQKDIWIEKNVLNHIKKAILLSYKENNYSMPILNKEKFNIDFKKINSTRESLKEIKELTEINNGKLLTKKWHGNDFKYKFQFDTGEMFFRTAKNMKKAGWPKDKERYLKKYAILEK